MWSMSTMEHYSALKRKEILTHVTWMNLENIMLSETSTSQKDLYHSTYMKYLELSSSLRQEVGWWLPGVGRREYGGLLFNGYGVSLWDN